MPDSQAAALVALLGALKRRSYRFVTPSPATHARVVARPEQREASDLAGVFGWNLPFAPAVLDDELLGIVGKAAAAETLPGGLMKSAVRVAELGGRLYLHSSYPTDAEDAVFFGPDSYRFAALIDGELTRGDPAAVRSIIDIGTGSGVGAITAAVLCPGADFTATDINPGALRFAAINAASAGVAFTSHLGATLDGIDRTADLILANPPYIADDKGRAYRDGGAMHGAGVSLDMTREALPRLSPGGRFVLYSGSAIVGGEDRLRGELARLAAAAGCTMRYRELDPDVFGEELDQPAYREVERIAVIAAVFEAAASA